MDINEEQDRIINEFSKFDNWLEKYEYLLKLGKMHSSLNYNFKTDKYALQGCNSQVWIVSKLLQNNRLVFSADSESMIIRGVLSLILRVVNNRHPKEIATAEVYFTKEIGLSTALSPVRANGVKAIVKYVKKVAVDQKPTLSPEEWQNHSD